MRKLGIVLIITIGAAVAASSHSSLAKDKSAPNLYKQTATGKHYDKTVLTVRKPTVKPGAKLTPDKVEAGGENIRR